MRNLKHETITIRITKEDKALINQALEITNKNKVPWMIIKQSEFLRRIIKLKCQAIIYNNNIAEEQ